MFTRCGRFIRGRVISFLELFKRISRNLSKTMREFSLNKLFSTTISQAWVVTFIFVLRICHSITSSRHGSSRVLCSHCMIVNLDIFICDSYICRVNFSEPIRHSFIFVRNFGIHLVEEKNIDLEEEDESCSIIIVRIYIKGAV